MSSARADSSYDTDTRVPDKYTDTRCAVTDHATKIIRRKPHSAVYQVNALVKTAVGIPTLPLLGPNPFRTAVPFRARTARVS